MTNTVLPQDCQWSSSAGGALSDVANGIISDQNGNTFISGSTRSNPCYFQTDTIIRGSFLVKYNSSGTEEWVIEFKSYNPSSGNILSSISGIDFDTINDHILITGNFYNYLDLPDTTLHGNGLTVFLVKMDTDGHTIWARTAGGSGDDDAFDLTYDDQSNIYISGATTDSITFDGITIPRGGFLAKYDVNGNVIWAKKISRNYYPSIYISSEAPPLNLAYANNSLFVNGYTLNDTIVIDTIMAVLEPDVRSFYLAILVATYNVVPRCSHPDLSLICFWPNFPLGEPASALGSIQEE